jgi:hypothetical protein
VKTLGSAEVKSGKILDGGEINAYGRAEDGAL